MDWLDIKEFFKDTFKYIILIVIVLLVAVYIVSLQQIVGSSMSPTFNDGDIIILDKISPKFIQVKRGDIISFKHSNTKYLIKRVIGVPGDYVELKNNKLYIDGNYIEESYLGDVINKDFSLTELGYETIPDGMYLVLGDNREDSLDSRDSNVGLIKKEDIIGKVRVRIWPLNKFKIM